MVGEYQKRFLPMNHPRSLLEHGSPLLRELQVLVATRGRMSEGCTLHELAQEASRDVIPQREIED
jgi:hypothetical protein